MGAELAGRRIAAAKAANVEANHAVAHGEQRDDPIPHPRVAEPAMHEHDRRPVARLLIEEAGAVYVHVGHGPTLLVEGVAHHVAPLDGPTGPPRHQKFLSPFRQNATAIHFAPLPRRSCPRLGTDPSRMHFS